jgi:hypothetical protein
MNFIKHLKTDYNFKLSPPQYKSIFMVLFQSEANLKFRKWTKLTHLVERILLEAPAFKGEKFPYKSPTIQMAFNEVRFARMFGGDCLRLLVNGEKSRSSIRFIPADYDATYIGEIDSRILQSDEMTLIQDLKTNLRDILYDVIDNSRLIETDAEISTCSTDELLFYRTQFAAHLKRADQLLGLRIGELYAERT